VVFKILQPHRYLDGVCNGEKIMGYFDAFLRYRGRNFEILGAVYYTKFSPSWGPIANIFLQFERAHQCTSMNKFIGKSNLRKFVKNANKRGQKFSLKNSKVRPPGRLQNEDG